MGAPAKQRLTKSKKIAFIEALARLGCVSYAAHEVGASRYTLYKHRKEDEEFAAAWEEAEDAGTEVLETEAYRRAVHGAPEPKMLGDALVEVPKYSDALLMFLLKGRRPDKYRERRTVKHEGLEDLAAEMEKARKRVKK